MDYSLYEYIDGWTIRGWDLVGGGSSLRVYLVPRHHPSTSWLPLIWSSLFHCMLSAMMFCLTLCPKAMELEDHELSPLKL
jgi:hypothetical protein